ncbi:hypothetical protein [Nonomuraea sp. NPDC049141]|uniref:hypothetical protein n=1 Tax=Nonomuraea sp. NPDC049141 TaxID=3155500 RepID=UPI00340C7066
MHTVVPSPHCHSLKVGSRARHRDPIYLRRRANRDQAASADTTASCYRQAGNHWNCITPGAYCPKAAHRRYGYAKITKRQYRCGIYSNGQWRWKRV